MASTIVATTLTVSLSESITLNGQTVNSDNQLLISNINEVDKRVVTAPTGSEVTLLVLGTTIAAGQVIRSDMKYLRITNKDDTNFVRIRFKKNGAESVDIKIDSGKTFMLGNGKLLTFTNAAAFTAFVDADSISAQADTAAVDVELFTASI